MEEYFLPDMNRLKRLECNYKLRVLEQKDFGDLYLPTWGNALCADRKELDVLGVGAYDGERLIGLAACSADCDIFNGVVRCEFHSAFYVSIFGCCISVC